MLDSDVAMLYHYPTKRINEVVIRNKQRFPKEFCFQLTEHEFNSLRCQFVTLNRNNKDYSLRSQFATTSTSKLGSNKYRRPYVFT